MAAPSAAPLSHESSFRAVVILSPVGLPLKKQRFWDRLYNNLAEFILGGEPNPANPGAGTNQLAPVIAAAGGNHIFSFRRTQVSTTQPGISIGYEYGSDLVGWTTVVDGVNGITVTVTPNGYGSGIDEVDVSIPDSLAPTGLRFVRLHATLP